MAIGEIMAVARIVGNLVNMTPENWRQVKLILDDALSLPQTRRADFLAQNCGEDVELRREIESLLEFEAQDASLLEYSAFDLVMPDIFPANGFVGKTVGKYRIIREIGAGGMGVVFLAERADGEFEQKVAVKIIKGVSSRETQKRFNLERQILALLEHPFIARLIDGGTTGDGVQYLVMEYIEGDSIIKYADAHRLDLTARLDLFRQICAAVSYAHLHLIVHRDLKPSNILITKDGTPKLLDFGIAKIIKTEDSAETRTNALAFTPEYSSPEQLRGETLTTATDIYSLGIVLYELLTKSRPFQTSEENIGKLINAVTNAEPPRPSTVGFKFQISNQNPKSQILNPKSLKGDLDNIVLKAVKRESERRYSSVEQFSEDIRRHLRGLPVLARPDTLAYRAEKFISRNPLVFSALLIAFVALVGGLLAAGNQARIANAEREKAERRFNDVRSLANSFMFEINEEIEKSPIKARQMLAERAVQYLDKLAADAEKDISLQSELATAYEKIGDVQAGLYKSNIGDSKGALENYGKALQMLETIYAAAPDNLPAGLNLSTSLVKMGEISAKTGNAKVAVENFARAVNLNERFVSREPNNPQARRQLAESLLKLGQGVYLTGNLSEVLTDYRRSLTIYEQLAMENPADAKARRAPAVAASYVGYVLGEMGDAGDALNNYRKCLGISEQLLAEDADNLQARSDVREFQHWMAIGYREIGDTATSLAYHRKSQKLARQLLLADETNVEERNTLADSQLETAKTLTQAGQTTQAVASFKEAISSYEQVQKADAENRHVRRQIFHTKFYQAIALANAGRIAAALEIYRQTLMAFQDLTAADPSNLKWQHDLASNYLKIGEVQLAENDKTKAVENFQKAVLILENLFAKSPQNAGIKRDLTAAKNHLAN